MPNVNDILRRMVREQTSKIGGKVSNLWQGVEPESPGPLHVARQQWWWSTIAGQGLLSLSEFFAAFATDASARTELVEGREGFVVVATPDQQVQFLRGTLRALYTLSVPITVSSGTPQGEWAVYLNGTLQRRGVDTAELTLTLDRGRHLLEVVAYAGGLGIQVPKFLEVTADQEALDTPQWESVRSGYSDPLLAVPANILTWYNDPHAGGWTLHRREPEFLGAILDVGAVGVRGQFSLVLSGDATGDLEFGEELTAGHDTLGTVLGANYDATAETTAVRVRGTGESRTPTSDWVGRACGSGRFSELSRIRRAGVTSTVRYTDPAVQVGNVYEYKLQAFGAFDETQTSLWSDLQYIRCGDLEPPANISFITRYPRITTDRRVIARFTTPIDDDYAGVRVYFRELPYTNTVLTADVRTLTIASGSLVPDLYVGHTMHIYADPFMSGDVYQTVASNDAATFYMSGDLYQVPVIGTYFEVFYDKPILTDFGLPDAEDQLSFDAIMSGDYQVSGDYYFRSFDHTGNEQVSGAAWNPYKDGVPSPTFGVVSGEASMLDGFDPENPTSPSDGCVWLPVILDEYTEEIHVYAEQSLYSPVPISELSNNTMAWRLRRQEGLIPNTSPWETILMVATKPNHYQRLYAYGVGYGGQRGPTYTQEVQAVDTHTPTFGAVYNLAATRTSDDISLVWDVDTSTSVYPIEAVVLRNGYPLARLPVTGPFPQTMTLLDEDILSNVDYSYSVFLWTGGISSAMSTNNTLQVPVTPTLPAYIYHGITFQGDLPGPTYGHTFFEIYYSITDPNVATLQLFRSNDGLTFTADATQTAPGYGYFTWNGGANPGAHYFKLYCTYTNPNQAPAWSNTHLQSTANTVPPPLTPPTPPPNPPVTTNIVLITNSTYTGDPQTLIPPPYCTLDYDTNSIDAAVATLELYVSTQAQTGYVTTNLSFSVPGTGQVQHDFAPYPAYYRFLGRNGSGAIVGWSNTWYSGPVVTQPPVNPPSNPPSSYPVTLNGVVWNGSDYEVTYTVVDTNVQTLVLAYSTSATGQYTSTSALPVNGTFTLTIPQGTYWFQIDAYDINTNYIGTSNTVAGP